MNDIAGEDADMERLQKKGKLLQKHRENRISKKAGFTQQGSSKKPLFMASISWTETTPNDLAEINNFICKQSLAQAERVINSMVENGEALKRCRKRDRELHVKGGRGLYTSEEESARVLPAHHSARWSANNPAFEDEDL